MNTKYIITEDDRIIVFPGSIDHSRFSNFNPKSAGFIGFGVDYEEGEIGIYCYGGSESLGLSSRNEDVEIAYNQLLEN